MAGLPAFRYIPSEHLTAGSIEATGGEPDPTHPFYNAEREKVITVVKVGKVMIFAAFASLR